MPESKDYLLVNVRLICKETEQAIQKITKLSKGIVPTGKYIMFALTSTVLKHLLSNYE